MEVLLAPFAVIDTPEVVRASICCRQLHQLLFREAPARPGASMVLAVLAHDASIQSQHRPHNAELGPARDTVHVHGLGLAMQQVCDYCKAMCSVAIPQALCFTDPAEIAALIAAHENLRRAETSDLRGSVLALGPPVGSLQLAGEACAVVTFTFETQVDDLLVAGPVHSQWQWVEVPKCTLRPGSAKNLGLAAAPPLRVGVRLQLEAGVASCWRPEMQCVVAAPTAAWVHLEAFSAIPSMSFELGLAAGGFDAYSREGNVEYFPREECSWRSTQEYCQHPIHRDGAEKMRGSSGQPGSECEDEEEPDRESNAESSRKIPETVRLLLRVRSAVRIDGWRKAFSRAGANTSASRVSEYQAP